MIRTINAWWKSIAWFVIIVVLSLTSSSNIPKFHTTLPLDKIVHFTMYFVLVVTILGSFDQDQRFIKSNRYKYLAFSIGFCTGLLMEILQLNVTSTRHAEWFDMLANTVGCLIGLISYPGIKRYLKRLLFLPLIPTRI